MNTNSKGFFALLIAAVTYGSFGLWIRELSGTSSDFAQVGLRGASAATIFFIIILFKYRDFSFPRKKFAKVSAFAIGFPIAMLFFTASVSETKIANTTLMFYAGSLLVSFLLGVFVLKEKITRTRIVSLFLVTLGLILFADPFGQLEFGVGLVYGIFAGLADGVVNYLRKDLKDLRREIVLFWQYFMVGVVGLVLSLLVGSNDIHGDFTLTTAIVLLMYGFALFLVGTFTMYGFKHFDLNLGTIVLSTEIFFALIFGYLFLSESPTTNEFVGGIIIFLAAIVAEVRISRIKKLFA